MYSFAYKPMSALFSGASVFARNVALQGHGGAIAPAGTRLIIEKLHSLLLPSIRLPMTCMPRTFVSPLVLGIHRILKERKF
jgi:hypothetical protein